MTPGTAGRGDGMIPGTTAAGMAGAGMAVIAIIRGLTGDAHGVATGVATGAVATGEGPITGIVAGMDTVAITTTVVTTAVAQA